MKEAEKIEQQLNNLTKKFQSMESQFDVVIEDLFNASIKLEEKEKVNHKQWDTRAEWDILNPDYLIWVSNGHTFNFLLKPFFLG